MALMRWGHAGHALETALSAYITDRRDIPAPSPHGGRNVVGVSLAAALKLTAYEAMRKNGWRDVSRKRMR